MIRHKRHDHEDDASPASITGYDLKNIDETGAYYIILGVVIVAALGLLVAKLSGSI